MADETRLPDGSIFTIISDITDHMQAEEDRRVALIDAEQANQAKSEFLATMSRELRTPLNAILGFSEIIRSGAMGPTQPARYSDYANDIHESGQYLLNLINDIFDLAKIEEGKIEVKDGPVSITGCIKDAIRLISNEARDAHISITTDVPASVPPLRADSRMLVQICTNLLSNAVKFTAAASTSRRNTCVNFLCRRFKPQRFAWSFVQLPGHPIQIRL